MAPPRDLPPNFQKLVADVMDGGDVSEDTARDVIESRLSSKDKEGLKDARKDGGVTIKFSKIMGEVHDGVTLGKRVTIRKGSVVKAGHVADFGSICENDIVEKAYSYTLPGSVFPIVITQKYLSVGCMAVPLKYLFTGTSEDANVLGGIQGKAWYDRFGDEGRAIVVKHLEEFGPKEMLAKCPK